MYKRQHIYHAAQERCDAAQTSGSCSGLSLLPIEGGQQCTQVVKYLTVTFRNSQGYPLAGCTTFQTGPTFLAAVPEAPLGRKFERPPSIRTAPINDTGSIFGLYCWCFCGTCHAAVTSAAYLPQHLHRRNQENDAYPPETVTVRPRYGLRAKAPLAKPLGRLPSSDRYIPVYRDHLLDPLLFGQYEMLCKSRITQVQFGTHT